MRHRALLLGRKRLLKSREEGIAGKTQDLDRCPIVK